MFRKLLQIAILVGGGYFLVTQVVPLMGGKSRGPGSSGPLGDDGGASRCVSLAYSANDMVSDTWRRFGSPPVDLDRWSDALWQAQGAIGDAANSCGCPAEACATANQALGEMSDQLSALDDLMRGTSAGYSNPASRQEHILALLEDAESGI